MTTSLARLVFPALRGRHGSFAHEREKIDDALRAGVGGFIIFGGERETTRALTRHLTAQAGRPLLIGADLERGAGQEVHGLTEFPPAAALGALGDLDATAAAAMITATEARTAGVNWAFAPVCDLDVEPRNPIIQTRSFGAEPARVSMQVATWVKGCQEHGVLACAKHFPGHGRTLTDSHAGLPVVDTPRDALFEADLLPFEAAIQAGVGSVMSAYVAYTDWDRSGRAAAFSPTILGYLRETLSFGGPVVTDALIMAGATATEAETPATVSAVAAGCDLLLYPNDYRGVITGLHGALGKEIAVARADAALERYDAALRLWGRAPAHTWETDLAANGRFADSLADRSLQLLRGEPSRLKTAPAVSIIDDDVGGPYAIPSRAVFAETLRSLGRVEPRTSHHASQVVLVFASPLSWKGRADLSQESRDRIAALAGETALVVLFGHPRIAPEIAGTAPLLCAWHGEPVMQRAAARWVAQHYFSRF